ncbi:MAG: hypothetical protein QM724_08765 [Flavobacteriales bacterium]
MDSFYTIIYAGINPVSGDKLAVGLFMRGGAMLRFAWSRHRTALVRDLMGADAQRLLVQNLKTLQRKAEEGETPAVATLFVQEEARQAGAYELNEPYFRYLSRYSSNLLSFGTVTQIELETSEERFHDLFRLLVDDRASAVSSSRGRDIEETKTQLKERIGSRVNWNAEVSQQEVPGLLLPTVRLDFIGRNGKDVIGEVVDFEKREFFLEADLNKLDNVSYALDKQGRLGKAFVVGDEPDASAHPHQHRAWKALQASERIELVPTNEIARVEEHLTKLDVRPWRAN